MAPTENSLAISKRMQRKDRSNPLSIARCDLKASKQKKQTKTRNEYFMNDCIRNGQ